MNVNKNYQNIADSYLFSTIAKKVSEFAQKNPDKKIIKLGIGDVTLPLCKVVVNALKRASEEMGVKETFHGYGPEQGYDFLKSKIQSYYRSNHVALDNDEIFISDGAKSDLGNILDLFDVNNTVLVPDPVYPVLLAGCFVLLIVDVLHEKNIEVRRIVGTKNYWVQVAFWTIVVQMIACFGRVASAGGFMYANL